MGLFSRRIESPQTIYLPPYPEQLQRDILGNIYYEEVVDAARQIIGVKYKFGRHHIGAAVKTASGKIFAAVNLETTIGRVAICAESIAIGMAVVAEEFDIKVIASFSGHTHEIVPPCGMCRELFFDYASNCEIVIPYQFVKSVPSSTALYRVPVKELLPCRYKRHSKI